MNIATAESLVTGIIKELEPYTHEDWDEEGASPITSAAIFTASEILQGLGNVEKPKLSPIVDGSIGLFWDTRGIYLDLQALPTGDVAFKYRLPDGASQTRFFSNALIPEALEALRPTFGYIEKPLPFFYHGLLLTGLVVAATVTLNTFNNNDPKKDGLMAAPCRAA
jgi:hypothetical protein